MELSEDVRRINGVEVHFPYKPYPSQISMMAKIIAGVKNKQNCLLESPTGSGKSLALLCSALAWQNAQYELARKEEAERSEIENGCCLCNQVPDIPSDIKPVLVPTSQPTATTVTPEGSLQIPGGPQQQVALSATPVLIAAASSIPHPVKMISLLSTPKQSQPSQACPDDDDDFKESTKKFRTPGSVQTVSRTPIRMQYETPAKTVIVKHLSKGPDGQMQEQQTVLQIPQGRQVTIVPGVNPIQQPQLASYIIQTPQGAIPVSGPTATPTPYATVIPGSTGAVPSTPRTPSNTTGKNSCSCQCKNKGPPPTRKKIPKIYFGTRTHKQIAQIIRELRKTFYKDAKMTILASREHTCIHPGVSKSSSKKDGCRDLLDGPGCLFNSNVRKISSQNVLKNFYGRDNAWDIEDLVNLCSEKKVKACPYYVSRGLRADADIVFCPYNYLVDPIIRKSMEIHLKEEIIILDEAHNIEDSAREAVSKSIEHDHIVKIIKELEDLVKKQVKEYEHHFLLQMCVRLDTYIKNSGASLEQRNFEQASKVWAGMDIVARLVNIGLGPKDYPELKRVFDAVCEEEENDRRRDGGVPTPRLSMGSINMLDALFTMLDFMYRNDLQFVDDYRVAIVRSMSYSSALDTSGQWLTSRNRGARREMRQVYTLNFWCLNPAVAFSDFSVVHNVVLTSGTLSPMGSFSSELGMAFPIALEANHVIKDSQVWVGSMGEGPNGGKLQATFKNTETWGFQDELGKLVLGVCKAIPHGVLCFFPSYKMLSKLSERWQNTGLWGEIIKKKKIVSEPRGGDKVDFDELLRYFYSVIEGNTEDSDDDVDEGGDGGGVDGALFLAVCRGKVSEGLDFADNNARAVITVGIPFPNIKDIQVELKRKYNDQYTHQRGLLSGSEWYEIQAYRALNQALGRCIRHRNDWGALVIVDERFVRQPQKYLKGLSKWVRNKAQTYGTFRQALTSLTNFTQSMVKQSTDSCVDISIPQCTPSTSDTPAKVNGYPLTGQLPNGDLTQLADLAKISPVKPDVSIATPTQSIQHVNQPTSTPISHISPPMSLPDRSELCPTPKELKFDSPLPNNRISQAQTEKGEEKISVRDKLMKFQFLKSDSPRTSEHDKMSENQNSALKDSGVNKFYKFCNLSADNSLSKSSLSEEKEGATSLTSVVKRDPDCSDVKPDETLNDEEFLMSTPNLFDSDMSDPDGGEGKGKTDDRDQSKETGPAAKRPLFRRAAAKASELWKSWIGVDQTENNMDPYGDGENSKPQVRNTRKTSSESDYDVAAKVEGEGVDLDESLNTKRNTRGRKRKVLGRTRSASKRTKGVDFLDEVESSKKKSTSEARDGTSNELTCSKCGASLISSPQGMERCRRLPSFLRSVWKQRNCETVFISQGKPSVHLKLFTSTAQGSDGAVLNSHWDEDNQCCVQFLHCVSCQTKDQSAITAARITMVAQDSSYEAGQMWILASHVT